MYDYTLWSADVNSSFHPACLLCCRKFLQVCVCVQVDGCKVTPVILQHFCTEPLRRPERKYVLFLDLMTSQLIALSGQLPLCIGVSHFVARCYRNERTRFTAVKFAYTDNSTQKSHFQDTCSSSTSQQTLQLAWDPKLHYFDQNNLTAVPYLSHMKAATVIPCYFVEKNFNIILPSTPRCPMSLFPSGFPTKYTHAFKVNYLQSVNGNI
jgi:hypothetical protein